MKKIFLVLSLVVSFSIFTADKKESAERKEKKKVIEKSVAIFIDTPSNIKSIIEKIQTFACQQLNTTAAPKNFEPFIIGIFIPPFQIAPENVLKAREIFTTTMASFQGKIENLSLNRIMLTCNGNLAVTFTESTIDNLKPLIQTYIIKLYENKIISYEKASELCGSTPYIKIGKFDSEYFHKRTKQSHCGKDTRLHAFINKCINPLLTKKLMNKFSLNFHSC